MPQIPAVYIIEGLEEIVVARNDAHRHDRVSTRAEQYEIAWLYLFGEASDGTRRIHIGASAPPWAGLARADQGHAVAHEDVSVGPVGRAAGDLPYNRHGFSH